MWQIIQQFIVVLFGSGASLAIANLVFQHRRDERVRKDAAGYLAVQLAFLLEGYVIRCANAISDHETARSSDGHAGTYISKVPIFDPLPESTAYQYLDTELLGLIFELSQRRDMAQDLGMFYWNMLADEEATQEALEEHTVKMAQAALSAADVLRTTYQLGPRDLIYGKWDIRDHLNKELARIREREQREEREELEDASEIPAKDG